jgi:hypothetical protein
VPVLLCLFETIINHVILANAAMAQGDVKDVNLGTEGRK